MRLPVYSVVMDGTDQDRVLKTKAAPVGQITDEIKEILKRMRATMHMQNGIGIAAPQVGISRRMAIINTVPVGGILNTAVINPSIIKVLPGDTIFQEGCLSVPNKRLCNVRRNLIIEVKYTNEEGVTLIETLMGIDAICFQHELDHLDGVLISSKDTSTIKP